MSSSTAAATSSPTKQKSYLGLTKGQRKLSDLRKTRIKESLGAILAKSSEYSVDEHDDTEEVAHQPQSPKSPKSLHARQRTSRRQRDHDPASPSRRSTPRRTRSGGSILSAMQSAGKALSNNTPKLVPRRSLEPPTPLIDESF